MYSRISWFISGGIAKKWKGISLYLDWWVLRRSHNHELCITPVMWNIGAAHKFQFLHLVGWLQMPHPYWQTAPVCPLVATSILLRVRIWWLFYDVFHFTIILTGHACKWCGVSQHHRQKNGSICTSNKVLNCSSHDLPQLEVNMSLVTSNERLLACIP